ncbi:MAG: Replicative DNA helicase, partial [Candidatus Kaiserbacteria bacterium GW2011_GWB1_50_17]
MVEKALRIPPQDTEMERALLGALLLNQNAMYEVADLVGVDSFYAGKHRIVFDAMLSLYAKSEPIDVVTVSGKLKERKQLTEIGGAAFLGELTSAAASPGSARHYAESVQTKFVLRALLDAAAKIGELGFQEDREVEEVLDEAQAAVFSVTQTPMLRSFSTIKDELTEAWERLERLQKHEGTLRGVPTGFAQLDNLLAGLQKSDLILLAARPSMGKTALALDIARLSATKHGTSTAVFSLEMSSQQLVDRMLAAQAGVNSWRLRTGKIKSEEEFERLQEGMSVLAEAPIYIDDITPTHTKGGDSMVQQVTEISRALKGMARELDIPVLALSQLSRAVETRRGRPRLSDLRDSGCLAGDTLLTRADTGERIAIKDLVGETNIPIHSLTADYRLAPLSISRVFSSGKKQLYELRVRSGRIIKASGNHPFLTFRGWDRLDTLKPGDRIALPRMLSVAQTADAYSKDEI